MFCVLRFAARVSGGDLPQRTEVTYHAQSAYHCAQRIDRVRAEPSLNVPKARIIAAGCIISEAASFARKGKHHSQRCAGNSRPFLFPFHTSPFTRDRSNHNYYLNT